MRGRTFITVGDPQQVVVFEAHDMSETPGGCARKCSTPELTACVKFARFGGQFVTTAINDGKGEHAPEPEETKAQDGQE